MNRIRSNLESDGADSVPVRIRPAVTADQPLLCGIYTASRTAAGCYPGSPPDAAHFAGLIEGEEIQVAEIGGELAGFVSVWVADRFIHHLYVLPRFQRQGVGSALLRACVAGYGLPLSLKCDLCNLRARRFYAHKGWVATETGTGDHGPWERLSLNPEIR